MADIYLAISETPTVVTLTNAVINSAVASSVTVMNTVTVALDANSLSALENVTVTVGAAITGTVTVGNSVTISSLPAISGTVTANVLNIQVCTQGNFAQTSAIQTALGVINTSNSSQVLAVFGSEAVEGEGISAFVQVRNPISGTVTIGSALPAGTNRIGVVTIGAGTVTIGAGTAQIGTVTASNTNLNRLVQDGESPNTFGVPIIYARVAGGELDYWKEVSQISGFPIANQLNSGGDIVPFTIAGTVTANPIGTQTIAGSVTASLAISSTAITSGSFSSLTSATLVPGNVARKMATVYNLGAGQLFVNAGASATTLGGGFMVALSSGDYFECDYTTTTLSAIFATAGTASWVSH